MYASEHPVIKYSVVSGISLTAITLSPAVVREFFKFGAHRPVLLGMCQPQSGYEPLDPRARNGAGHRLLRLSAYAHSRDSWRELCDRRNVLDGPVWLDNDARKNIEEKLPGLANRVIVALGQEVADLVLTRVLHRKLNRFCMYQSGDYAVVHLPHPSGRSYTYNSRSNVTLLQIVMEAFYKRSAEFVLPGQA